MKGRAGEHCPFEGDSYFPSTSPGGRGDVALPAPCRVSLPGPALGLPELTAAGRMRRSPWGLEVRSVGEERVVSSGLSERGRWADPEGGSPEGTGLEQAVCLCVHGQRG